MSAKPDAPRRLTFEHSTAALLVGTALFASSYAINFVLSRAGIAAAETIIDNVVIGVLEARVGLEMRAKVKMQECLLPYGCGSDCFFSSARNACSLSAT